VLSPRLPGGCVVEQQRLEPIQGAGEAASAVVPFSNSSPAALQLVA
jgi:hypothetical protein